MGRTGVESQVMIASRRLCLATALALALAGCPREPESEDAGEAALADALAVEPAGTDTATTAETTTTATLAEDDLVEPTPGPRKLTCKDGPAWTTASICAHEDHAFAVGAVAKIRNASLARDAAANRARALLAGQRRGLASKRPLSGSEVISVVQCGDAWFALVRSELEALGAPELPRCPQAVISAQP